MVTKTWAHFVTGLQNGLQWTCNLLHFLHILLQINKMHWGNKYGAYTASLGACKCQYIEKHVWSYILSQINVLDFHSLMYIPKSTFTCTGLRDIGDATDFHFVVNLILDLDCPMNKCMKWWLHVYLTLFENRFFRKQRRPRQNAKENVFFYQGQHCLLW